MEEDEEELEESDRRKHTETVLGTGSCDESKCVSTGRSDDYGGSFTCYGSDIDEHTSKDQRVVAPPMCADGHLPVILEDEPASDTGRNNNQTSTRLRYFTCCPPSFTPARARRRCSDPVVITEEHGYHTNETTNLCQGDDLRKHPRPMKPRVKRSYDVSGFLQTVNETKSFLCCESDYEPGLEIRNDTIDGFSEAINHNNHLEEVDCVPYRNDWYDVAVATENQIGNITRISCEFSDSTFSVPRPLGTNNRTVHSGMLYQCCRTGVPLLPFVHDTVFRISVYPTLLLSCLALVASVLVALGLLVPLCLERYRGHPETGIVRSDSRSSLSLTRGRSSSHLPTSKFNTYNLYLVYLAITDSVYLSIRIAKEGSMVLQNHYRGFSSVLYLPSNNDRDSWEVAVVIAYANANLLLNALIAHKVLVFLKRSNQAQRVQPPSLARISAEAGVIYLEALALVATVYCIREATWNAEQAGELAKRNALFRLTSVISLLTTFVPIIYVGCVTTLVWYRGYMPSLQGISRKARATRELAVYFFRIIGVFVLVWVPALVVVTVAFHRKKPWGLVVSMPAGPVQAILTFLVILTKSDVRKYICDLVTLSYLFGTNGWCRRTKQKTKNDRDSDAQAASVAAEPNQSTPEARDASRTSRGTTSGTFSGEFWRQFP